jgi:DNA-binding NtrC family response regulator
MENDYGKYALLVVDDEETLREAIAFDFKRKGFNVQSAANGTQALEIVKQAPIDLIISDVRMPNGDGLELLREVRRRDPEVPVVVFVTGFADATEEECLRRGAWKVFAKPFDRKALFATVVEALERTARPKSA